MQTALSLSEQAIQCLLKFEDVMELVGMGNCSFARGRRKHYKNVRCSSWRQSGEQLWGNRWGTWTRRARTGWEGGWWWPTAKTGPPAERDPSSRHPRVSVRGMLSPRGVAPGLGGYSQTLPPSLRTSPPDLWSLSLAPPETSLWSSGDSCSDESIYTKQREQINHLLNNELKGVDI